MTQPPAITSLDVSICIVSWNVRSLLRDCLKSLREQAGDVRYETIVVDNASTDGSPEMVREEFPWVKLVEPHANLGFGRANNLAYRESRGRYVLLLNPDTVILDRAIERLVRFTDEHPEAGRGTGGRISSSWTGHWSEAVAGGRRGYGRWFARASGCICSSSRADSSTARRWIGGRAIRSGKWT